MKISIGSDHGGFKLKEAIINHLKEEGHEVYDFGPHNGESVDYPDYAYLVARSVKKKEAKYGIVVCTTGIGVSITANKVKGVRAALCTYLEQASLTRLHNDSNVLALAQKYTDNELAFQIVDTFINTEFSNELRHKRRVNKIKEIEALEKNE